MSLLRRTFRGWWQAPRKLGDRPEEREVSFLELFYDLVYVVLIAQLAHALAKHADVEGVAQFAFLFTLVWWAWFNGAMYHDLHGNNDFRTRVSTFIQMFTVAAMAVFAHDALGSGAAGFAFAYASFLVILAVLWWRAGVHDADHRRISDPFSLSMLISAGFFVASVYQPDTWRVPLWAFALVSGFLMTLRGISIVESETTSDGQQRLLVSDSAVERFGLFTIIVLGEVIVGTVQGLAGHHGLSMEAGLAGALGMMVAMGMWWVYFDFISRRLPRTTRSCSGAWVFLHLPMTMGVAASGAAVLNFVEHAGEAMGDGPRWLLAGAIAMVLVSVAGLMRIIDVPSQQHAVYRRGGIITFVMGMVILALGASKLEAIPLMAVSILLMLLPVFYGLKVWILMLDDGREWG